MDNPYVPRPYTILDVYRETPDTFTLTVDMKTDHAPGQFVQVSVPGIGESPISICSDSREFLRLNIREVGNVTKALAGLKKGEQLLIRGPYGTGYPMEKLKGKELIIIGGGCGIAPLKGIIDYVENHRKDYGKVLLFLGYRSPNDIIFSRELEEWRKQYHITVSVDQNPKGEACYDAKEGFVTDSVKEADLPRKGAVAFVCGPPVMMEASIAILRKKGLKDKEIYLSAERLMYCALGVCCHCMIRGKFTCVDGPVFRYDEIRKWKND